MGLRLEWTFMLFMPKDVPNAILKESIYLGAKVYLVDGLISHAAKIVENLGWKYGWFDLSTNKQPYKFEGYKVMAMKRIKIHCCLRR